MGICYIVGAGDFSETAVKVNEDDYFICADAGYKHKDKFSKAPDLVIGDYDSLGFVPDEKNKVVLPCEKYFTDMHFAVNEGVKKGFRMFRIYGAMGGERNDHSLANLQLLHYIADLGGCGYIYDGERVYAVIKDGIISLPEKESGYVSVFSLTDTSEGVYIRGLKYELENYTMKNTLAVGVSNEFVGKRPTIGVRRGALLVTWM